MVTTVYGSEVGIELKDKVSSKDNTIYGLGFPVGGGDGGAGFFYKVADVALLKQNVKQFLATMRGERVMIPSYGLNLFPFLFEPLDEDLVENIQYEIVSQFKKFFPTLQIVRLRVSEGNEPNYFGRSSLKIELKLMATNLNNTLFKVGATIT